MSVRLDIAVGNSAAAAAPSAALAASFSALRAAIATLRHDLQPPDFIMIAIFRQFHYTFRPLFYQ